MGEPSVDDVDPALDILLNVLGLDREALAFRGSVEAGFEHCNGWPG